MKSIIRELHKSDWPAVREIYLQGIKSGLATFETQVPDWAVWDQNHLPFCRYVYQIGDRVVGWLTLSPVSNRAAYSGVAELSVYVDEKFQGQGIGKSLLNHLISTAQEYGIWTLQATIFEKNVKSIDLHSCCGFRMIGYREKISRIQGEWINTVIMEKRFPLK